MRMEHQAAEIRAEVARLEGRRGRGKAYPAALRRRALGYYCARRAQGAAMATIGFELGMPWQTLQKWASSSEDMPVVPTNSPSFALVEVVETTKVAPERAIRVRGPAGISIEGLDLDALVELLRRLS